MAGIGTVRDPEREKSGVRGTRESLPPAGGGRLLPVLLAVMCTLFALSGARADDAVVFFSFEEIEDGMVRDLSGNGYHGRVFGEPEEVEGGLRFFESWLVIPEVEAMNVGQGGFTVEVVIELEPGVPCAPGNVAGVVNANYETHDRAWGVPMNWKGEILFVVRDAGGGWVGCRSGAAAGAPSRAGSGKPIPVGEPVHVVGTFTEQERSLDAVFRNGITAGVRKMYINGELQPQVKTGPSVGLDRNISIMVGAEGPGERFFHGIFREMRLYNRPIRGEGDPILERGRRNAHED